MRNSKRELLFLSFILILSSFGVIWFCACKDTLLENLVFNKIDDSVKLQKIIPYSKARTIARYSDVESFAIINMVKAGKFRKHFTEYNTAIILKNGAEIPTYNISKTNRQSVIDLNNKIKAFVEDDKEQQIAFWRLSNLNLLWVIISLFGFVFGLKVFVDTMKKK